MAVKLVMDLHHVSQGGNQGESQVGGASVKASPRVSRGGEASDGPSPCESRGQPRGVPSW